MTEDFSKQADDKMQKAIEVLFNDLKGVRSGRASPMLVENIKVEYYGTPTPIKQVASITAPEPRALLIKPFDTTVLGSIEKAIQIANIGLNPHRDGNVVRISIPPLTEETRKQLVEHIKTLAEKTRTAIRNVRRDINKTVEDNAKEKKISEDAKFRFKDDIQKLTDRHEKKVNEIIEKKNKEVMEG